MAKKKKPERHVTTMRLSTKLMTALSHIATQENRSVANLVETVLYAHAQKALGVTNVDRAVAHLARQRAVEAAQPSIFE